MLLGVGLTFFDFGVNPYLTDCVDERVASGGRERKLGLKLIDLTLYLMFQAKCTVPRIGGSN